MACYTVAAALALSAGCAGRQTLPIQVRLGACDWTLEKAGDPSVFSFARQIGLDGVQVSIEVKDGSLPLLQPGLQKAFLDSAERNGVGIASFAIGQLNEIPYKSDPAAERFLSQAVDIAAAMNVQILLVPFFGKGDLVGDPAGADTVVERLKKLAPKAEKAGVVLALESWLSAKDHVKIMEAVGSPAVKVYYDVGNSDKAGHDIFSEILAMGPKIAQFHAKDYKDLYGKGSMDFKKVRASMEAIGYNGWFVMEGVHLPLGIEASMKADLEYLRTVFPALVK
jgi:sugar phosphate isomerase/epimerase